MSKIFIDPEGESTHAQRECFLLRLLVEIAIKLGLSDKIEKHCAELGIPFSKEL